MKYYAVFKNTHDYFQVPLQHVKSLEAIILSLITKRKLDELKTNGLFLDPSQTEVTGQSATQETRENGESREYRLAN